MTILKKILKFIDSMSEMAGSVGKWFAFLLVLVGSFDAISRHFFNAPTIWAYDTMCMAGGIVYMLGASYDYKHDAHTRVDIIYGSLSEKGQSITNIICSLFLFFPLMIVMFRMSVIWAMKAWKGGEVMFTSFWYPPAAPYRTIFALGLLLLILQGLARFIREIHFVVRGESID
jgi:TRAP-type mannitol/chloroaromatic compound transport system permease small subunit